MRNATTAGAICGLFGLLWALPCHGAEPARPATSPATRPTSRPALPATPAEAMRRFMLAWDGGDEKATRAMLVTDGKLESEAADVWAALSTSQFTLRRLVFEKFRRQGLKDYDLGDDGPPPQTAAEAKAAAEALLKVVRVKVDGNTAVITHPQHPEQAMTLRKASGGGWGVVFASVQRHSSPEELKRFIRLNKATGPIYRKVAGDLKAGKF